MSTDTSNDEAPGISATDTNGDANGDANELKDADASSPNSRGVAGGRVWAVRALIVTGALVLGLGLLELGLHGLYRPAVTIRFKQDVAVLDEMGLGTAASILQNDNELFWRLTPDLQVPKQQGPFFGRISNSQGLREDHQIPPAKPAGEKRVLFLGDSCTFGFGVEHSESFVQVAESQLRSELAGVKVECINAGVPAYSLFQGWRYLETEGYQYEPDVLVLCFGGADMTPWDGLSDVEHYRNWHAAQPPDWLRWSRVCQISWRAMNRPAHRPQGGPRPRVTPEEFSGLLNKVWLSATDRKIPIVFLIWPFRMQVEDANQPPTPWQSVVPPIGDRNNVTVVDLVHDFRKSLQGKSAEDLFFDRGHTTAKGHALVADSVVRVLRPQLSGSGGK